MIVTLPFNAQTAERTERLADAIYWTGGGSHCLLITSPGIHPEMVKKVRISAQTAFQSVDMIELPMTDAQGDIQQANHVFRQTARYVADCYNQPWLWLEPQCVPLQDAWLDKLDALYLNQSRRYLGPIMQGKTHKFLHRIAVYPPNATTDLDIHCMGANPFNRVANILPRTTGTMLFKVEQWKEGLKLDNALLIDGDPTGALIEQVIERSNKPFLGNNRAVKPVKKKAIV